MKRSFYLCGLFLAFSSLSSAFGQGIGCVPLQPFLDKNKKEIHESTVCTAAGVYACWIEKKKTCYWVGSPAQCTCIQQEGTVCNGALASGDEFGYCKWGEEGGAPTGCIDWRLHNDQCKKPGYGIDHTPPQKDDYCRMLGGEVKDDPAGPVCENYYNNAGERKTCSLDALWQNKCP